MGAPPAPDPVGSGPALKRLRVAEQGLLEGFRAPWGRRAEELGLFRLVGAGEQARTAARSNRRPNTREPLPPIN
jgi:hypothetical protein